MIWVSSIFPHLLFPQISPISYSETSFFILFFNSSDPVSAAYIFFGVFFHWSMVHLSGDMLLKKKNSSSLSKYHFSKFFREGWDLLPKYPSILRFGLPLAYTYQVHAINHWKFICAIILLCTKDSLFVGIYKLQL